MSENSKYNVFIDNYKTGINQFLNNISGSFFDRISLDKDMIVNNAGNDTLLMGKIQQIGLIQKNSSEDNYAKLKVTGKILLDLAFDIMKHENPIVKKSGINIINSFFDVAKQTEDEELLKTALEITNNVNRASAT